MARKKAAEKKEKEQVNDSVAQEEIKEETAENQNEKEEAVVEEKENTNDESGEEEVKIKEVELDYKDKYLRLSAEFDNYRKRTLKEKMDLTKTAGEEIIKKMLPVVDDFDRGLQHMDDAKDVAAVKEGVVLIYNKLSEVLKQQGVKEIEAKEQTFDMEIHEAITKIPAPSEELKGKVVDVVEKGYYLNEKIIRYPKVVVGE